MKIPGAFKKLLASNKDEILVVHIFGCGIKTAYFKRVGAGQELQDWAIAYHPDILKMPDNEIVNFLVTFIQKNSIKTKEVILSLGHIDGVVMKETLAQAMRESEDAGGVIKFQLAEDIKFDANLAQVGWRQLSEVKDKEGTRQNRVLALVIDRNLINRFVALIELCKLYVGVITSYRFHWEAILKDISELQETCAILDLEYTSTTLSVYVGKQLFFSRELPITLKRLIEALEGKDTLDPAVPVVKLLHKLFGVPFPGSPNSQDALSDPQGLENYYRLRPLLEIFARDINLSFSYLNSHLHTAPPQQVFLTGDGGNFKSLMQFLKEKFGLETMQFPIGHPVSIADQHSVDIQDAQDSVISLAAIALGDHQAINLIPVELQTNRFEKLQKILLIAVSALVLAIFLFMIGRLQIRSSSNSKELARAYQRLEELEEIILLNKQIIQRQEVRNFILSKEMPVDGLLKQVSASIPEDIMLKRIYYDRSLRELRVEGKIDKNVASKDAIISKFVTTLGQSPFFTKASVTHSQTFEETTDFQITCQMKHD